jgi:hypothetical protein
MKIVQKTIFAFGIAITSLTSSFQPALAQYYDDHGSYEVSAEEIISGALVIEGLEAVIIQEDRSYRNRSYYQNDFYSNGINGRQAVKRCIRRSETWAEKYGIAEVTEIHEIRRTQGGYRVEGNLVVEQDYGDVEYSPGYDKGRFTCFVERGRVSKIKYHNLEDWD